MHSEQSDPAPEKKVGSKEESEVAGFFAFSHIRIMGYFRLDYVRVNVCPEGF